MSAPALTPAEGAALADGVLDALEVLSLDWVSPEGVLEVPAPAPPPLPRRVPPPPLLLVDVRLRGRTATWALPLPLAEAAARAWLARAGVPHAPHPVSGGPRRGRARARAAARGAPARRTTWRTRQAPAAAPRAASAAAPSPRGQVHEAAPVRRDWHGRPLTLPPLDEIEDPGLRRAVLEYERLRDLEPGPSEPPARPPPPPPLRPAEALAPSRRKPGALSWGDFWQGLSTRAALADPAQEQALRELGRRAGYQVVRRRTKDGAETWSAHPRTAALAQAGAQVLRATTAGELRAAVLAELARVGVAAPHGQAPARPRASNPAQLGLDLGGDHG